MLRLPGGDKIDMQSAVEEGVGLFGNDEERGEKLGHFVPISRMGFKFLLLCV